MPNEISPTKTVTISEELKGGFPTQRDVSIPNDQEWLWFMLSEQTKILKKINTAIQIVAVIVILTALFAGFSVLF